MSLRMRTQISSQTVSNLFSTDWKVFHECLGYSK